MILLLQCLVICFHVTTENGTETESRPKMSVICASIFHIERPSERILSQCPNLCRAKQETGKYMREAEREKAVLILFYKCNRENINVVSAMKQIK